MCGSSDGLDAAGEGGDSDFSWDKLESGDAAMLAFVSSDEYGA